MKHSSGTLMVANRRNLTFKKKNLIGGSDGKESSCSTGDLGSIPGLGRSPGKWNGYPLQYSCLENPHGQRSLMGCSPWGCKESDTNEQLNWTACTLNKQGDNTQPWCTPFPIWNQSVVPCPVLTVASWPTYRFLRRQVRCSGIPISLRIFHSLLWAELMDWIKSEYLLT